MPIPCRILHVLDDGGTELLEDSFVVPQEACRKFIFGRVIDLLAEDREEVAGVVVDYFVNDDGLYFSAGCYTKCGDLGLNEMTDIRIVAVLLVSLVDTGTGLALDLAMALASAFLSSISIPNEVLWSVMKCPAWSIFVVSRASSLSSTVEGLLSGDVFDVRRRQSGLAIIATTAGFGQIDRRDDDVLDVIIVRCTEDYCRDAF